MSMYMMKQYAATFLIVKQRQNISNMLQSIAVSPGSMDANLHCACEHHGVSPEPGRNSQHEPFRWCGTFSARESHILIQNCRSYGFVAECTVRSWQKVHTLKDLPQISTFLYAYKTLQEGEGVKTGGLISSAFFNR